MKNLFFIIVISFITTNAFAQKIKSNKTIPNTKSTVCKCDEEKAFINCWSNPADATGNTYIVEIQFSFPTQQNALAPACNYVLDSIFFMQSPSPERTEVWHSFNEYTKVMQELSTDKKTFRAQYKIPTSVYITELYLNRPMYSFIKLRYGTTNCRVGVAYKITDALL